MLDLAVKHLLGRYTELHAHTMVNAMRSSIASGTAADAEPKAPRAFCGAWADALAAAKAELIALQGEISLCVLPRKIALAA